MAVITLTPRQLAQKWANLPNKLEVNIFNFETLAGNVAKKIFRGSFDIKRFNSNGSSPWRQRSPKSTARHPLLYETGNLKNSIVWRRFANSKGKGVSVYTDPFAFKYSKRQYDRNKVYAGIHNQGGVTKQGWVIPARQFMGHSTHMDNFFMKQGKKIFEGFHL